MPEALFNISRFLLMKIQEIRVDGISKLTITYALIKQARILGANKLAMQLLERLRGMKIPHHLLAQIEVSTLGARAYQYRDPEELLPLCYRCSTFNALLPATNNSSNRCVQCGLKFQHSFVMFEILPLVEFELDEGIEDEEAEKLIEDPAVIRDNSVTVENQMTMTTVEADLFTARLIRYEVCFLMIFPMSAIK